MKKLVKFSFESNVISGGIRLKPNFLKSVDFMVFILLYCPCIASIIAIIKETESWKYGAFAVLYNTVVAWIMAFVVYQVASLF